MKFKPYLVMFALGLSALGAQAVEGENAHKGTTLTFSTQVSRTVEQDLMQAVVYSSQTGKNLPELREKVSASLNQVVAAAKKSPSIELETTAINNYVSYDSKGKVNGWMVSAELNLQSKDFSALAAVLENLTDEVAIQQVGFRLLPQALSALEEEMTLEAIKQFQHKAEVVQKGLNAKSYVIESLQLDNPSDHDYGTSMMYAVAEKSLSSAKESLPLEAGKTTVSARAQGSVKIEP